MSRPIVIPVVVNAGQVLTRATQALKMNNVDLAKAAKVSLRTVSRWWSHDSAPGPDVFQRLAVAAFPTDPALAADLATAGGVTLEQLGLVTRPAATAAAVVATGAPVLSTEATVAPIAPRLLAEAVVCSAAEELDAPPRAVRGIVRAVFRRAREMRLSVEAMDDALSSSAPPPPEPAPRPAKRDPKAKG